MYDIPLLENEKIKHIIDDVKIYEKDNYNTYSIVLTNIRLLILNDPSSVANSLEDLRCIGRISYIKKKEIIFKVYIKDIIKIEKNSNNELKIYFKENNYIIINDPNSQNILNHIMIYKTHSHKE